MILACRNCAHIWRYQGQSEEASTSCPHCKGYVSFTRDRVDQPLPDATDYGGAEYIGVTSLGDPIYFDSDDEVAVTFIGRPDVWLESREEPAEDLVEYVKDIGFKLGWKFRRPAEEIQRIAKHT